MGFFESITGVQLLAGIVLLLFSVSIALKTRKSVPQDLRGRWAMLTGFIVFFVISYLLFSYLSLSGMRPRLELVAGSIFLAGALFVVLVLMITRTTVLRIHQREAEIEQAMEALGRRMRQLEDETGERMRAERELSASEQKYRSLVESTDDSIYVVDRDMVYIFMNDKHIRRLGLTVDGYRGRSYAELHSSEQAQWFEASIEDVFLTGRPSQHEYMSRRDGGYFLQTMSPVRDRDGSIMAVSVISKNITRLKEMEARLLSQSLSDELTGLLNRRGFFAHAEQALKRAAREDKAVCLLYVDLDYLKLINDNLGHAEGDRALVKLGRILRETFRDVDIVARIGGDEFAAFPVDCSGVCLDSIAGRLQDRIDASNAARTEPFELSISTGIAVYDPDAPLGIDELLNVADKSMYMQKKQRPQV